MSSVPRIGNGWNGYFPMAVVACAKTDSRAFHHLCWKTQIRCRCQSLCGPNQVSRLCMSQLSVALCPSRVCCWSLVRIGIPVAQQVKCPCTSLLRRDIWRLLMPEIDTLHMSRNGSTSPKMQLDLDEAESLWSGRSAFFRRPWFETCSRLLYQQNPCWPRR